MCFSTFHEGKSLSIKEGKKAFVHIANASFRFFQKWKIKVKNNRECLNVLLKTVLRTFHNLALQGTSCLIQEWQYNLNNKNDAYLVYFLVTLREYNGSTLVIFIKLFSCFIKTVFVMLKVNLSHPQFRAVEG